MCGPIQKPIRVATHLHTHWIQHEDLTFSAGTPSLTPSQVEPLRDIYGQFLICLPIRHLVPPQHKRFPYPVVSKNSVT